jgi:hypothetical protein
MSKVNIEIVNGRTKIIVEGHDISNLVSGYTVTHNAGELPIVNLKLIGTDANVGGLMLPKFPECVKVFLESWSKNHSVDSSGLETAE